MPVAAEILVEGRVQGVGYRAYAQRRATEHQLTGYAVNLRDGRVKIRVEGSREAIVSYTRALEAGPPLARVNQVSVTSVPFTGLYRDFAIRFSEGR
jgi:acylphosphatase